MKIAVIIENKSIKEELIEQYGLSLFVQTKNGNILIDAGQDESAKNNFLALGFKPQDINAIFISHNHYDHIGGLQYFLDITAQEQTLAYVSSDIKRVLYSKTFFKKKEIVSCNNIIDNNINRLKFVKEKEEILPNVYACRVVNPNLKFSCKDKKLKMLNSNDKIGRDDFSHELYFAVIEENSVKIISPCSHNGIINIINDAKGKFNLPVSVFVGGLHLRGRTSKSLNCTRKYLKTTIKELNCLSLKELHTCHCTGYKAYSLIKKGVANKCFYFHTGETFEV